jgi:hypothetical protein
MPVMFSYDIAVQDNVHYARLKSMFERLHWQAIGGSCFRYPQIAQPPIAEDWLNHVVPALMLFRTYVLENSIPVNKYSLDSHSSTGFVRSPGVGRAPRRKVVLATPISAQFGEQHLSNWLAEQETPYAPMTP